VSCLSVTFNDLALLDGYEEDVLTPKVQRR